MPTNIFRGAKVLKKIKKVNLTHPDYASLVDPLFACGGKRVGNSFIFKMSNNFIDNRFLISYNLVVIKPKDG